MFQEIIEKTFTTARSNRMNEEKYFIQNEYQDMFEIHFENDQYWIVRLRGPDGSPFEGFWYKIRIDFPQDYPNDHPQVRFITPMYHPFISDQGDIYLDQYLLHDNWGLDGRIFIILNKVRKYLRKKYYDLELRIKSNKEIAEEYQNNYDVYIKNARQFAQLHGEQQ